MTISRMSRDSVELGGATSLTEFYMNNPKYQDTDSNYEGQQSRNEKIFYKQCDITSVRTDAIVCPTQNNLLLPPYGLCTKVWSVGGLELRQTCIERGRLQVGQSFLSNVVIFTAGPTPNAPYNGAERLEILRENYMSCLNIVRNRADIKTVAFPCLGTGGGGLMLSDANRVAVCAIRDWLEDIVNRQSVDVILLCMHSEEQWQDYHPQLLKAFPYGFDLQGNNLEEMHDVTTKHLLLPPCSTSTSTLCYKYSPEACKPIKKHFHRMVETCAQKLKYAVSLRNKFRDCAIFKPRKQSEHQVVIFRCDRLNMIEVQVTRFNDHIEHINEKICQDLRKTITEYFDINLENITPFTYCLRCHQSSWGQANGLWELSEVTTLSERRETCDRHEFAKDYHPILRRDMMEYWNMDVVTGSQNPRSFQALNQRREPVEISINSMTESGTSTGSIPLKKERPSKLLFPRQPTQAEETPSPSSSTSLSSAGWSTPSSLQSLTMLKTKVVSPTEHAVYPSCESHLSSISESHNVYSQAGSSSSSSVYNTEKKKGRKKGKLTERCKGANREDCGNEEQTETRNTRERRFVVNSGNDEQTETRNTRERLVVDSGNESQFSSQSSIRSVGIEEQTLCRHLDQPTLLKLAKHMGSYQKRIGLYLNLSETDIQNAVAKGDRDTELNGYYIIRKWMNNNVNNRKADIAALLKAYQECDIDVYQIRQELGMI